MPVNVKQRLQETQLCHQLQVFDRDMARRIDFIFLSYQFHPDMIKDVNLVITRPTNGLFTSDHFGLQVVLKQLPR